MQRVLSFGGTLVDGQGKFLIVIISDTAKDAGGQTTVNPSPRRCISSHRKVGLIYIYIIKRSPVSCLWCGFSHHSYLNGGLAGHHPEWLWLDSDRYGSAGSIGPLDEPSRHSVSRPYLFYWKRKSYPGASSPLSSQQCHSQRSRRSHAPTLEHRNC